MAGVNQLKSSEKVAVLLIALGKELSAQIFKCLTEDEIEQITMDIANVRSVTKEMKDSVLEEFYQVCLVQNYISEGGIVYAREILDNAIGQQKAMEIINKLTSTLQVRPFDFVRKADPNQILNFIQNEHPQTIALVFSYLDAGLAAGILSSLPLDLQIEVVARIAKMSRTSPEYIKEIERILERKLSTMVMTDYTAVGGVDYIVSMLNNVDRGTEKHILENLELANGELAEEIRHRMFVFEDIVKLNKMAIQRVLREVDKHDLTIALKGAPEDVTKVIYENISKRLQEMIREDLEIMGPVRVRDVEEAQQKIVNIIRSLDDSGEIIISRGKEDGLIA
jgi:flagellar motor switch protein FliG